MYYITLYNIFVKYNIMSTSQVSISLNDKTIKKLDSVRGLTKRSTIIEKILSDFLDKKKGFSHPIGTNPKTTRIKRGSIIA